MNPPADQSIPPDPKIPLTADNPNTEGALPAGSASAPPVSTDSPPMLGCKPSLLRRLMALLLSLCLGLFLAGGVVSLLDDSLVLIFGLHLLTVVSGLLTCLSFLLVVMVYCLIGLTPLVPKRVVLPVVIFNALALLAVFPTLIYHHNWMIQSDWVLSLGQVLLGLALFFWLKRGFKLRWPIVEVRHLGNRAFSWANLSVFLLLNVFVLLPSIAVYLALCASLAVGHFTEGFLTLRPRGLILQARKYVRDDGKTIVLFPMSHIAEADFYQAVSQSASSNSVVLLEGVTDNKNLLTNELSYRRAAKSLGLAEQHDDLDIHQGQLVRADVDVQDFSPGTVDILNLITLVHSRDLNSSTVLLLTQHPPPPGVEKQLYGDLLLKRNEHLLKELHERLPDSDNFVIPWGALHMPGIEKEIQKSGFHLVETREYVSIRFGPNRHKVSGPEKVQDSGNSK